MPSTDQEAIMLMFALMAIAHLGQGPPVTPVIDRGAPLGSEDGYDVYLNLVEGNLSITGTPQGEYFEAYFHIPIPYEHQVPISLEVEGEHLLDCRFVRLDPPNVLMVATLTTGQPSSVHWTSRVLILPEEWDDLPDYVTIPEPGQLPDSVTAWLAPSDIAQFDDPFIQSIAAEVRGSTENLMELACSVYDYCYAIPWTFPHSPVAFDAYYALKWGNSCTGHAHAAVALLRANGVPARSLMNCLIYPTAFDQHWGIDFFVPGYGWVRMDPSLSEYPQPPVYEVVTFVASPGDEFPIWFLFGCEASWHSSDPALLRHMPDWGQAHTCSLIRSLATTDSTAAWARVLAEEVFWSQVDTWGLPLGWEEDQLREQAHWMQVRAGDCLEAGILDDAVICLQAALDLYSAIDLQPFQTVYETSFESGEVGWTHGGEVDEWELGQPLAGPGSAHSGNCCWGTDMDGDYGDSADNWLLSPEIILLDDAAVEMEFWMWNSIVEGNYYFPVDRCWVEITTDGIDFEPVSSRMAGINDDPEVPDVGGWSRVLLDLHRYAGETVRLRFRFASDDENRAFGTCIDDVAVRCRQVLEAGITQGGQEPVGMTCTPNPCHGSVHIEVFGMDGYGISIYDCSGRLVSGTAASSYGVGDSFDWDCSDASGRPVASGVYYIRIDGDRHLERGRLVVIR